MRILGEPRSRSIKLVDSPRRWRHSVAVGGALGVLLAGVTSIATVAPASARGGWSIDSSPDDGGTDTLNSVSCVSSRFCVTVGDATVSNVNQTLIESWNRTWSIVPSVDNGTGDNTLYSVSCVSVISCVAVGSYFSTTSSPYDQTLIESWNGTSWSIIPSPDNGTYDQGLRGVSCVSGSSCMAVGLYNTSPEVTQTLIESWDGTSWSIVPSPDNGRYSNLLSGVSCQPTNQCVAVGYSDTSLNEGQTLVESWNGTSWSIVPSPNDGAYDQGLSAVSCVSGSSCTAVGDYDNQSASAYQTLVESWNGTRWSIVPSPNNGTGDNGLGGVTCHSTRSCKAVGSYGQTLVESWNGHRWSIISSPNGAGANELSGISCVSARLCKAVGVSAIERPFFTAQTLVLSHR